jgi:hypothetical protein
MKLKEAEDKLSEDLRKDQARRKIITAKLISIATIPENITIPVSAHFVASSAFLRSLDLQSQSDDGSILIPLKIQTRTLQQAVTFYALDEATPYPDIETPVSSHGSMEDMLPPVYYAYYQQIEEPMSLVFDIVTTANWLDLPGLVNLCCTALALHLRSKTPAEIQELFSFEELDAF